MRNSTCQWPGCGAVLENGDRRGRPRAWCDVHLRQRRNERSKNSPDRVCIVDGCSRFVRAQDRCITHYNAMRREVEPEDRAVRNGDPVRRAEALREKSRFRKSVVTALDADDIDVITLGDRDGWACGICSTPIDKAIAYPDRMAATIDHVIPISHGGRHRWSNVQLAHFACNMAKGDTEVPRKAVA